jgi:hypothetical protein
MGNSVSPYGFSASGRMVGSATPSHLQHPHKKLNFIFEVGDAGFAASIQRTRFMCHNPHISSKSTILEVQYTPLYAPFHMSHLHRCHQLGYHIIRTEKGER